VLLYYYRTLIKLLSLQVCLQYIRFWWKVEKSVKVGGGIVRVYSPTEMNRTGNAGTCRNLTAVFAYRAAGRQGCGEQCLCKQAFQGTLSGETMPSRGRDR
jgi:hypothetical protein